MEICQGIAEGNKVKTLFSPHLAIPAKRLRHYVADSKRISPFSGWDDWLLIPYRQLEAQKELA
jgi:hypothetical protein